MEKRRIIVNIICSLLLQVVTIVSGFILPKIIISSLGSETNGLVASINQFLNYVVLLEGGVSGVITASLYQPLSTNDKKKVSSIIRTTKRFFNQIGIVFVVYMCVVAFCYPLFTKTSQSYWYVVALTFVLGSNLLVQYFISLSYRLLLKADRKVYVESIVQLIVVVLNLVLVLITIKIYRDILVVKLVSAIVFLIQPIAFATYVNKNYHLDRHAPIDNTEIVVLTIFKNLTSVSVYSIYNMIVMALKNLVISISSAISPSIGNVLAKGEKDKINEAFELYEFGLYYVATIMFSCCLVLILPFVKVYTTNITDANYLQPVFAVLLVLAEFVYCIRDPYVAVAYASGKFRETSKYAIIEALINIVISVILVRSLGLAGIAIGTLIAMVYRMIAHVIYLQKNILFRSLKHFVKKMLVFTFSGSCVVLLARFLKVDRCINIGQWLVNAVIVGIGSVLVITLISSIFFKSTVKKLVISKIKK